jgi:phosphoglycolate phosphatase
LDYTRKNMAYKAIVFDLDGTLVNSLEEIATYCNRVLKNRGFKGHNLDAYRMFVGDGAATLMRRVLPEGTQEDTIQTCYIAFIELYREKCCEMAVLYKNIPELLDQLTARGIKMTILSNKVQVLTEKTVDMLMSSWKFEAVFGQRDTVPRKPDPAGAYEIAEKLKISPSRFIYLGDTAVDMKTSIAAGMFPAAALWGFRDKEELQENGAQALIEDPLDIIDHLCL